MWTSQMKNDYQLKFVHGDLLTPQSVNATTYISTSKDRVQSVLKDCNFIGVTERFDESLAAMQLLFNLNIEDILCISSNVGGGYDNKLRDRQTGKEKCFKMHSSFVSPKLKQHFESDEWYAWNSGDFILCDAAKRSLDLAIEHMIGRDTFEYHLERFLKLKKIGNEMCADTNNKPFDMYSQHEI